MYISVLGSAAGGGFPQWNCNCHNCAGFRAGTLNAKSRTQSSIAVSSNGSDWLLLNASPDISRQISQQEKLQPNRAIRDTGIKAVMLMDSQIDHTTGLLSLREGKPLPIYCSKNVYDDLTTGFPVLNMLSHYCTVDWHELEPREDQAITVDGVDNIRFYPVLVESKAPPYSPHRNDPHPGDNMAVIIEDTTSGKKVFYAPGLGAIDERIGKIMASVDCLLVDGTCWTDDEMSRYGVGKKLASEMGHLYISGDGGSLEKLAPYSARKIFIHINNTNPILNESGPEYAAMQAAGVELAEDGMLIEL